MRRPVEPARQSQESRETVRPHMVAPSALLIHRPIRAFKTHWIAGKGKEKYLGLNEKYRLTPKGARSRILLIDGRSVGDFRARSSS